MSQISIGTKTLRAPSLGVGAEPSRWGHPSRVMWRLSAHSIGTKASPYHLSLVASRWGHPTGRVWFFSHSIATKSSLVIWSVFLQDGVTLFGSGSNNLISSEGIPTVGLLGAFFRPVLRVSFLSSFGRPVGSGFHIQSPPTACYLVVVVGLVRCEEGLGNGSGVVICPGRFNHATTASSEHPD